MFGKTALAGLLALAGVAQGQKVLTSVPDSVSAVFAVDESEVKTLHTGESAQVMASWEWAKADAGKEWTLTADMLYVRAYYNDELLEETELNTTCLPTSYDSPSFTIAEGSDQVIVFEISADPSFPEAATAATDGELNSISRGVSIVPLLVVIFFAVVLQRVEVALTLGIFSGALIVNMMSFKGGFKAIWDTYLMNSIADVDHTYVVLFTMFLSGLVGMMEKSGGVLGLSNSLVKFATTSRTAQLVAFACGFLLFFDDYTNALVVGATMRPITDLMGVSREKLAFIVDATSAPIAATFPISSWVGFEVGEINKQLIKIKSNNGGEMPLDLQDNGFSVYISSIPWRFYPIFMVFFQVILIAAKREFGPMLIAERKAVVYGRTDGGDGGIKQAKALQDANKPLELTPKRWWNMIVPVLLLIFLVLYVLFMTGVDVVGTGMPVKEIIQEADSYSALLFGTIGTSLITLIFYAIQHKHEGQIVPPTPKGFLAKGPAVGQVEDEFAEDAEGPRMLMSPTESLDAWLQGLVVIFPAVIVLYLAWAMAGVMGDVGADRFFSAVVLESGVQGELPAITFILSLFMALCTGTSWGTMGIMYPLTLVTAAEVAVILGDKNLFYAVVGSILSGAVCGDHCSPISDTTVLSSVATNTDLTKHVYTQLPYALVVAMWAILVGYLPGGLGAYSAAIGILIGFIAILVTVFAIGVPVVHSTGRFDPITELYIRLSGNTQLKEDTAAFYENGGEPIAESVAVKTTDL
mmetsp:Transcript_7615/g.11417  ORF Transcript_7615/g.11417 Transcript_7615/m.11417 type:complete len:751 (+) Transcript_7615:114-2366(+)|eukprot:CAMPEP_0171458244 /NCGR_PEP_ID=MMETSP0945-20130129/4002_1 /TAXON_ID=109269 /ORGANISM="Vaucheria litorea, Strain CCMP2940" /LENGTH=750 /DNA_ID=CAMNT_0011984017 /DNA_START=87 /DNA_END=2339 /DNA_ORIENTATION=+